MATVDRETALLTAEEFASRPDSGMTEELERGRVVMSPVPNRRHGYVCIEVGYRLRRYLEDHPIGRAFGNDAAVVTRRGPDTVRGADVSYYSFQRLPADVDLVPYGPEVPELVFEVLSPSDRWNRLAAKAAEYLEAGVSIVVVLDPERRTARVFEAGRAAVDLGPDDLLRLDSVLPGFEPVVGRLFG